jgi:hypothetical protein
MGFRLMRVSSYPRDANGTHKTMNIRIFTIAASFLLVATGLRAEFSIDSLVANAAADPGNAPAIVANAAVKNPKFLTRIVSATVAAFPRQAVDIVRALLKVDPDYAKEIVRAAIRSQPKLAVKITDAAVQALPDMSAALVKTAIDAAPDDIKDDIAASVQDNAGGEPSGGRAAGNGGTTASGSFPSQPINPDLVSPSS